MRKLSAKHVATLAVISAMSLITFMIESLFPPLILPGAKMGLSNVFSLLALVVFGPVDAVIVVVVRTVLGSMFTGNMSTLIYSLGAGLVSVATSTLLVETLYPRISIVAVSVTSAVMHNLAQNVIFCVISETPEMYSYMPYLACVGVLAGVIVGITVWLIVKFVPLRIFAQARDFDEVK